MGFKNWTHIARQTNDEGRVVAEVVECKACGTLNTIVASKLETAACTSCGGAQ